MKLGLKAKDLEIHKLVSPFYAKRWTHARTPKHPTDPWEVRHVDHYQPFIIN